MRCEERLKAPSDRHQLANFSRSSTSFASFHPPFPLRSFKTSRSGARVCIGLTRQTDFFVQVKGCVREPITATASADARCSAAIFCSAAHLPSRSSRLLVQTPKDSLREKSSLPLRGNPLGTYKFKVQRASFLRLLDTYTRLKRSKWLDLLNSSVLPPSCLTLSLPVRFGFLAFFLS